MNDLYLRQKLDNGAKRYEHSFSNRYMNWKRRSTIIAAAEKILSSGPDRQISILEIGCHEGDLLFMLDRHLTGRGKLTLTGIDLAPLAIDYARQRKEHERRDNLHFTVMDANNLSFPDRSFDLIISTEVIEHMPDPSLMLRGIYRLLNDNGSAIITTPNGDGPLVRRFASPLTAVLRRKLIRSDAADDTTPVNGQVETGVGCGHVSVATAAQWKGMMRATGLKLQRLSGTGGLLFGGPDVDRHRILFGISVIIDTLFERLPGSYFWSEILQFELRK